MGRPLNFKFLPSNFQRVSSSSIFSDSFVSLPSVVCFLLLFSSGNVLATARTIVPRFVLHLFIWSRPDFQPIPEEIRLRRECCSMMQRLFPCLPGSVEALTPRVEELPFSAESEGQNAVGARQIGLHVLYSAVHLRRASTCGKV